MLASTSLIVGLLCLLGALGLTGVGIHALLRGRKLPGR